MRYISPSLSEYDRFRVAPVEMRIERGVLSSAQRAEVVRYMREGIEKVLRGSGHQLSTQAGVGVATVRIAITDIQKAKWYLNVAPTSKVTGMGTGGASMEAEIISTADEKAVLRFAGKRGGWFGLGPERNVFMEFNLT